MVYLPPASTTPGWWPRRTSERLEAREQHNLKEVPVLVAFLDRKSWPRVASLRPGMTSERVAAFAETIV